MKKIKLLSLLALIAFLPLSACGNGGGSTSDEGSTTSWTVDKRKWRTGDTETIYDGYYADLVSWENGTDLKHQLYDILRSKYKPNSYDKNWTTNRNADQSLYNLDNCYQIYSNYEINKLYTYQSYLGGTGGFQREHAFPASLMTGLTTGEAVKTPGTATDFHNLFCSYGRANSQHSNTCMGYVNAETPSKVGNAKYSEYTFEPADVDKGRLSRAIFYIATMYGNDEWVTSTHTYKDTKYTLATGITLVAAGSCTIEAATRGKPCHSNLLDLIEWNYRFFPDYVEVQHTNYVQSEQLNRNPFVDFPALVDYIWGEKKNQPGNLADVVCSYYTLDMDEPEQIGISVKNVKTKYEIGDTFEETDLEVYRTYSDLTREKINDWTVTGVDLGDEFTEKVKSKKVTIRDGEYSYTYTISVANKTMSKCQYKATTLKDAFSSWNAVQYGGQTYYGGLTSFGSVKWNYYAKNEVTYSKNLNIDDNPAGASLGSSNNQMEEFILITAANAKYSGKTGILSAYVKCQSGSGESYQLEASIVQDDGSEIPLSQDGTSVFKVTYQDGGTLPYGGEVEEPITGKVKFRIYGITKALGITDVGIQFATE